MNGSELVIVVTGLDPTTGMTEEKTLFSGTQSEYEAWKPTASKWVQKGLKDFESQL